MGNVPAMLSTCYYAEKYDTILFSDSFLHHLLVYDCCELQYRYQIGHLRISFFFSIYCIKALLWIWHNDTHTHTRTHTNTWFWIVTTNPLNFVRSEYVYKRSWGEYCTHVELRWYDFGFESHFGFDWNVIGLISMIH